MIPFVLYNDEVLDASESRVLLSGMDLTRFEQNPVILLEHGWGYDLPIGRWHNIRKSGSLLLADAEFDEGDEVARFIKGKVERGFMSGASIGTLVKAWSDDKKDKLKGQRRSTATSSELFEASIVAIGDNPAALKQVVQKSLNAFQENKSSRPKNLTQFKNIQTNSIEMKIEEIKGIFEKGFNELRAEFKTLQPEAVTIENGGDEIESPSLDIEKVSKAFEGIEAGIEKGFGSIEKSFNELKGENKELKKTVEALKNDIAELKGIGDQASYSGDKNPIPVTKKSSNVTQLGSMTLTWS